MGAFADAAETVEHDLQVRELEQALDLERERSARNVRMKQEADRNVARITKEKDQIQSRLDLVLSMDEANQKPPAWTVKTATKRKRHGTPTLMLSDTHWGEVINPAEVAYSNAYNTEIATARLKRTIEGTITVTDMVALTYDGIVCQLGGDMFSGIIHRELDRTNDMEVEEAIIYWTEQLVGALLALAEHYGKVHVPGVVGNHGRSAMDRRMPGKKRAKTNIDWLLYRNVYMVLKNDKRFTWQIAEGADTLVEVYDTTYLLYHGNDFHGGSGIAGALSPVMLGQHRTTRQQMFLDRHFDWLTIGHFHQHFVGKGLIMNGSMKGYDEFAYTKRYEPERPSQAMWITTPENGLTFSMPIFCADPEAEGWAEIKEETQ